MKVTLSRNSPMGRKGQTREIDASSVRAAFVLGLAEPYIAPPAPEPKRIYRKKDVEPETPKPKRVYKRKDMVAEDPVEVVAVEPEPEAKPEPESEPDGDDETAVRL